LGERSLIGLGFLGVYGNTPNSNGGFDGLGAAIVFAGNVVPFRASLCARLCACRWHVLHARPAPAPAAGRLPPARRFAISGQTARD
jgi:hypothetical protein